MTSVDGAQISRQADTADLVESIVDEVIAVASAKGSASIENTSRR
jgi:hypothetical protein